VLCYCCSKKHIDNLFCSKSYIWKLEVFLFIKTIMNGMQTGQETDFVLVSCTGLGVEPTRREQVLKAKRVSTIFWFCPFFLFSCLVTFVVKHFPGRGRLAEEIRTWIHNHSPWSPTGNYCSCLQNSNIN
jgi:hypothetical protein